MDLEAAKHDPLEVLKAMRDFIKEQAIGESDRCSNRRGADKAMLAGGRKLDETTTSQSPQETPPGISDDKSSAGTHGAVNRREECHGLITPRCLCFGCGQAGHHRRPCLYRKEGERVANSGGRDHPR